MLPIIIFLEHHAHSYAKQALIDILPIIVKRGYRSLLVEYPSNLSEEEIIIDEIAKQMTVEAQMSEILEDAKRQGIDDKCMNTMDFDALSKLFEKMYPNEDPHSKAINILKKIPIEKQVSLLEDAKRQGLTLVPVDNPILRKLVEVILSFGFQVAGSSDSNSRRFKMELKKTQQERGQHMAINVATMSKNKSGGCILQVGADHFPEIVSIFKTLNLLDKTLFVYPETLSFKIQGRNFSLPKDVMMQCPHFITMNVDNDNQLKDFIEMFKSKLDSMTLTAYDEFVETSLVMKLKTLNENYVAGYNKAEARVDGILPLSADVNCEHELRQLFLLGIIPTFIKGRFLKDSSEECGAICVKDINCSSNKEKVNKIGM